MTTSCEIEYSFEELKEVGYYAISIPYEINHDFLLASKLLAQEGKIPGIDDVICFPDHGSGERYEPHQIVDFIWQIEKLENNIEIISQIIPIPTMVGMVDGRVIVGYESYRKYDSILEEWVDKGPFSTYVEILTGSYLSCNRKDILYILSLIKKLALRAKEGNKTLRFIGE